MGPTINPPEEQLRAHGQLPDLGETVALSTADYFNLEYSIQILYITKYLQTMGYFHTIFIPASTKQSAMGGKFNYYFLTGSL